MTIIKFTNTSLLVVITKEKNNERKKAFIYWKDTFMDRQRDRQADTYTHFLCQYHASNKGIYLASVLIQFIITKHLFLIYKPKGDLPVCSHLYTHGNCTEIKRWLNGLSTGCHLAEQSVFNIHTRWYLTTCNFSTQQVHPAYWVGYERYWRSPFYGHF